MAVRVDRPEGRLSGEACLNASGNRWRSTVPVRESRPAGVTPNARAGRVCLMCSQCRGNGCRHEMQSLSSPASIISGMGLCLHRIAMVPRMPR